MLGEESGQLNGLGSESLGDAARKVAYGKPDEDDFRSYRSPWFDKICAEKKNDPVLIGQELQIEYLASGAPRFELADLRKAEKSLKIPEKIYRIEFRDGKLVTVLDDWGELSIFCQPFAGRRYVVGIDPASGSGRLSNKCSRSGIVVLDTTEYPSKCTVVAVFQSSQVDPGRLARIGAFLAGRYNNALLNFERNGIGEALSVVLTGSGTGKTLYKNLYRQVTTQEDRQGRSWRFGWWNNNKTRPVMENLVAAKLSITEVRDSRLVHELFTYVWTLKGQEAIGRAAEGCTDDLVISLGLAYLAAEEWHGYPIKEEVSQITVDSMLDDYRDGRLSWEALMQPMFNNSVVKCSDELGTDI